ncbi:MAG: indolepyruvate ferredoxin oxidoreductase, partial [Pseudonocardiales bacterium]|nr:indolepyruvate ferredoxin oxidoreductase [Pseudonocardiales bacterium]
GYEGSPLGGYDLELARHRRTLNEHGIVHRPGLNEELAATSLVGTQLASQVGHLRPDGVTGVWYGKTPGLDRASDAVRHANLIGTDPRGGVVALVGDDPSAKSSSVPCVSEMELADLHLPTLYPADSEDVLEHGRHAVELSRVSGLWTAMKITTNVADGASTALVRPEWTAPDLSAFRLVPYRHRPNGRVLGANLAVLEQSLYETRLPLAQEYIRLSGLNRVVSRGPNDRIGIVAAGKTFLDVRQALLAMGLDDAALAEHGVRLLKLGAVYPVEPTIVTEFADGLSEIVIVEEKRSFLETAVKEILYGLAGGAPAVHGKRGPEGRNLFSATGELDPDVLARGLSRRLRDYFDVESVRGWRQPRARGRIELPLAARTPYFCSGCPHNSSTKVPDGSLVGAGIGCHAMVVLMPAEQVGEVTGMTQMGGEGAHWIGMAPFVEEKHYVQNMGDGTFVHSGSLAVRAAVAADVNITFKLLHNSAVAMTGGQDAVGALPVERMASLLLLEGVRRVVITTEQPKRLRARVHHDVQVRHRDELLAVQDELAATPGVTVLIHDQECAAEKRRKRRRGTLATPTTRVLINERVCEGCGDCGQKSNCLSVQPVITEFGRKTRIHQSSCNLDYSCLAGDCPSFLTVVPGQSRPRHTPADLASDELPEPDQWFSADRFSMRITGVGGTGVVTVAQVLATAAVLDGLHVRSLDQTGLAQKGGAVVYDLKITSSRLEQAAKLAVGECDLYLGCDSLVAADPVHLSAADPGRTIIVLSTAEVPTGRMVVDTSASFPGFDVLRSTLDSACRQAHYLDARALAESLFGDDQYANMLLVGAAYQAGALPLSAATIERAIALNGADVRTNVQAFRRGRQTVADPEAMRPTEAQRPGVASSRVSGSAAAGALELVDIPAGTELRRLLAVRVPDLVEYQNERYAREYTEFVERVRAAEARRIPGSTSVTEAVARNLHKLMAYKDEYEVARLSIDPALQAQVEHQFGAGARYSYRLHPPVLRAIGLQKKISLGRW